MKRKPGFALAAVLVLMGVTIFGVGGLISISTFESKISRSSQEGLKAYYVAESGMEDAMWRLNSVAAYKSALVNGNLNATYTATDQPTVGQGFTVTAVSTAANYASVTVTGFSTSGALQANRKIQADVFSAVSGSPSGTNAFMSGGPLNVNNSSNNFKIVGGDLYTSGGVNFNHTNLNMGSGKILTTGSYNANNSSITAGAINAANMQPAPASQTVPGFDFTYYAAQATSSNKYTAAQFQSKVQSSGSTVTFPGPITYISNDLSFGNWARNKTINITGMLVVNGNVNVNSSVNPMTINITDPGTGKVGLFVRQGLSVNAGNWNIQGVLYASGAINVVSSGSFAVDGGIVSAGSVSLNPGTTFTINYNAGKLSNSLSGTGGQVTVGMKHWEEEY